MQVFRELAYVGEINDLIILSAEDLRKFHTNSWIGRQTTSHVSTSQASRNFNFTWNICNKDDVTKLEVISTILQLKKMNSITSNNILWIIWSIGYILDLFSHLLLLGNYYVLLHLCTKNKFLLSLKILPLPSKGSPPLPYLLLEVPHRSYQLLILPRFPSHLKRNYKSSNRR